MKGLERPQKPLMLETKDISKKGLIALVLLTVVVSLIGSFLVLNEISHSQVIMRQEKPAVGSAQLGVHYPENNQPSTLLTSTGSTGRVTLQIQKNPNLATKKAPTSIGNTNTRVNKAPEPPTQTPNPKSGPYFYEDRGAKNGHFQ